METTENKNSPTNMSVSEPNLTASEASAVSLLETFAAVARRRTSATSSTSVTSTNTKNQSNSSNSSASGLFGTKSVSSLVRLAISSNFPASLLNSAQSYPSLGGAVSAVGQGSQQTGSGTGPGNPDTEQVSLEEFLESCRATSLLAELEDDDEELPDADEDDNDEDDANDDEDEYEDDANDDE